MGMMWIHKFYENELGYRSGISGQAGRHIELPDSIAINIYKENDEVPITFQGRMCRLGFQPRPDKETWLNKLTALDPDKSILKPGMYGLFFIEPDKTFLILIDPADSALSDIEKVFLTNKKSNKKYDAVIDHISTEAVELSLANTHQLGFEALPKPFILLAGISGTGKTRFVKQQAISSGDGKRNFCLVPVRPDWHEPSDLLGYISRIGNGGPEYVITDVLKFMVKAWCAAYDNADENNANLKDISTIEPYWLCLDEMNLAPVEQYFADYLSVLETRKWVGGEYSCDALLKLDAMSDVLKSDGMAKLRKHLGIELDDYDGLWSFFCKKGIPLPPNLIVAGTVNMDETTHGFSRKVLDRAFTIDFGAFFPNEFQYYLSPESAPQPITFGFPVLSQVGKNELVNVPADTDGAKSIAFLDAVNAVLKGSPFELAYRAVNELMLAVVCFAPKDDDQLKAVWDDFLMTKVLPQIEGDADKLRGKKNDEKTLLEELEAVLKAELLETRPDLFRKKVDTEEKIQIETRCMKKLQWMQTRLADGFTSFWP